ncbi:MAG: UbiA family prenyltransferase [Halioglobus sp.]
MRTIVVDLDGTLVRSDMLLENFFLFLRLYPLQIFRLPFWLMAGRANLKRKLADTVLPSIETVPFNDALVVWLIEQHEGGARLVLATGSDARIAHKVADHLGIFSEVLGTEDINLTAENKRRVLVERYGEGGFEYVGNALADFVVWQSASLIHVANPERGVLEGARERGSIGKIFDSSTDRFATAMKAIRPHQWSKNILILVPLLASHRIFETSLLWDALLAFIAFGACASSVYLFNDLLDLPDDRRHATKKYRPLAAGTLPIKQALILIPCLLVFAFGLALWALPFAFSGVLAIYSVLTLAYSLWLKRVAILDVLTLAMLYTARVVAGAAALSLEATFWILAFCMFIFISLAFLKRYTELYAAREDGNQGKTAGRGYYAEDFELLASLGASSGYLAVLVLALYINESDSTTLYLTPEWMWLACPLLLYWLSRAWLLAHRGQMHDDPIVFALRDTASRWIGVAFLAVFALASV